jgi:hypothetical protein
MSRLDAERVYGRPAPPGMTLAISTTSIEPTTGTTDPAMADLPEVQQAEQQQDKEREEREKKSGK